MKLNEIIDVIENNDLIEVGSYALGRDQKVKEVTIELPNGWGIDFTIEMGVDSYCGENYLVDSVEFVIWNEEGEDITDTFGLRSWQAIIRAFENLIVLI